MDNFKKFKVYPMQIIIYKVQEEFDLIILRTIRLIWAFNEGVHFCDTGY